MRKWLVAFALKKNDVRPDSKGKVTPRAGRQGSKRIHCYRNMSCVTIIKQSKNIYSVQPKCFFILAMPGSV
jgi:hypothetical protein